MVLLQVVSVVGYPSCMSKMLGIAGPDEAVPRLIATIVNPTGLLAPDAVLPPVRMVAGGDARGSPPALEFK